MGIGCSSLSSGSLYRLSYASTLVAPSEIEAEKMLSIVIACALKNNGRQQITGMLYFDAASFGIVQVLEGPPDAVMRLFSTIKVDPRHRACKIIDESPTNQRLYAGFGMALARVSQTDELATITKTISRNTSSLPAAVPTLQASTPSVAQSMLGTSPLSPALSGGQMPTAEVAIAPTIHLMRLQYRSVLLANTADEGRRMLGHILERAMAFNAANRIGGLLVFHPSTLAVTQILEGPAAPVLDLFDRISIDSRHRGVVLTSQEVVLRQDDVQFDARWGMMQIESAELDLLDLSSRLRMAHASDASDDFVSVPEAETARKGARAHRQARIAEIVRGGKQRGGAPPTDAAGRQPPLVDATPEAGQVME